MSPVLYVLLGLVLLVGIYWLTTYNGFISKRNKARNAFSSIDIQLKKRWDLIPALVGTAKGYAAHEKELFESITKARQLAQDFASRPEKRMPNEADIGARLPQLMALTESYPELKADRQFILLQRNLTEIESQISASRRTYNATVTSYNTALESAPSNIIAARHNFQPIDLFNMDVSERANVSI